MFKMLVAGVLAGFIGAGSLLANDHLYGGLVAGGHIGDYFTSDQLNEIDCGSISIPLYDISKCYMVLNDSINEKAIGNVNNLSLIVSTINDKVNTVTLFKVNQDEVANKDFLAYFFDNNWLGYSAFNFKENIPMSSSIMTLNELDEKRSKLFNSLADSGEDYILDIFLIKSDLLPGNNVNAIDSITSGNNVVKSSAEITEQYNVNLNMFNYRIDIVNYDTQHILYNDYNPGEEE